MRWAPALLLAAAACAGGPRGGAPGAYGLYHVREAVADTRPPVTIEGTIQYRPDTLIVDVLPGPCRPEQSGPQAYLVTCNELRLWFDRRDPMNRNTYSVRTIGYVTEKRCASYGRDASGNNRCLREVTEYIERTVTKTGRLHVRKN